MKLYRKFIRPMHGYPGPHYEPKTEPIEKEEKWYQEEEREHLENKYGYLNKKTFSDLVFDEKYEPCDDITMLKEQEWISVKDRLPNCNGCYLVWRPHFYTEKGMPSICYFDGQNTWHDSYGVDFTRMLSPKDVSHWMPLPEQPKER